MAGNKMQSRFEIKTKVLGMQEGEEREGKVLSRVIRVGEDGWQYEPDQRHVDLIISELGKSFFLLGLFV